MGQPPLVGMSAEAAETRFAWVEQFDPTEEHLISNDKSPVVLHRPGGGCGRGEKVVVPEELDDRVSWRPCSICFGEVRAAKARLGATRYPGVTK